MNQVIILGGPGGSGRSSLAKDLASELQYDRLYGGKMLRDLSLELGYGDEQPDGTLTFSEEQFIKFHEQYRPVHPEVDLRLDLSLFDQASKGNVVIESMTFAPLTKRLQMDYLRIWVTADEDERVRRILEREHASGVETDLETMKEVLQRRTDANVGIYERLYGFNYLDAEKYYEIIFDTTHLAKDDMAPELLKIISSQ